MPLMERRKYFLKVLEDFYQDIGSYDLKELKGDILIVYQSPTIPSQGLYRTFTTSHHSLLESEEDIYSRFSRTTKQQIKQSEKNDGLNVDIIIDPDSELIDVFAGFYATSHRYRQHLPPCNTGALKTYKQNGILSISMIKDSSGDVLVYHANIINNNRVRILYSVSKYVVEDKEAQSLIGRANRFLHWNEMLFYKNYGLEIYDLGGLALGKKGEALEGVDTFKLRFGGDVVEEYNCAVPITLVGRLAVIYMKRRWMLP